MTDLSSRRGLETKVYQPAEDSRLLAEVAVERVTDEDRVLDVGTGSGYVAAEVNRHTGATVFASDINPHACRRAMEIGVPPVRANLTDPFRARSFDYVLFNPPYLPRDPKAERDDWMEKALTGGETGREVVTAFLDDAGRILVPGGNVLIIVSSLTDIEAIVAYAADRNLVAVAAREELYPFERLVALEITTEH